MIVAGGLLVTVCRVILLHEARVANSLRLLSNHRLVVWTPVLDLWHGTWGSLSSPRTFTCNRL